MCKTSPGRGRTVGQCAPGRRRCRVGDRRGAAVADRCRAAVAGECPRDSARPAGTHPAVHPHQWSSLQPGRIPVDSAVGPRSWRDTAVYIPAQVVGCIAGAMLANLMFGAAAISWSTKELLTGGTFLAEIVATAGLILVIFALARTGLASVIPRIHRSATHRWRGRVPAGALLLPAGHRRPPSRQACRALPQGAIGQSRRIASRRRISRYSHTTVTMMPNAAVQP